MDRAVGLTEFRPTVRLAVVLIAVAATVYTVRLGLFILDPSRADDSVLPSRPFFRAHSCLSSYTEAARLAPAGVNVFDPAQYGGMPRPGQYEARFIGPFEIDLYQYPPPFLLLPRSALAAGLDFFTIRRVWFVLQAVLLLGAMLALARWIGDRHGTLVLLLIPAVWLAPTTRVGLQLGNFQLSAFPLAVLALIAFDRARTAAGALALGFAIVSKIFPGILGLLLLAHRRWRAVWWTAAASVAVTAFALLVVGPTPFVDFVRYQLPRMHSAEAFFWIESPEMAPVNQSIYGLVTKLRLLGIPGTGARTAILLSSIYALLLVPVAVVAARRLPRLPGSGCDASLVRLRHAQVWLGLLSLASFRSPFVPDAYGLVGTLWLLTLIAAERHWRAVEWLVLAAAAVAFSLILDGGLVPTPVPIWMVLLTLGIQLAALAVNAVVVLAPARRQGSGAPLMGFRAGSRLMG
jgi:alpha-1,2-mannosyltransferase